MSEFVTDDWKLKSRTVVKLYRKDTDMLVFLLVRTIFLNLNLKSSIIVRTIFLNLNLKSSIIKNFIIITR